MLAGMDKPSRRSRNQVDRLVLELRQRVLRGEFAPGQRVTELGLVPLLGASRTPVRLALERLAHEGLLDTGRAGGFRVRAFTIAEILDSIEIRAVLEGTAVRLAAERLVSPKELARLKSLSNEAKLDIPVTVDGFGRYLEANDLFHRELWRLSKSPALVRMLELACRVPFAAPGALVFVQEQRDPGGVYVVAEHHRAIIEAIESREGTRGEALAREHSRVGRQTVLLARQQGRPLGGVPGAGLIVSL
jgi:GntR family transcriptional regulator, vanillate catabolism transcriptional regulator